MCKSKHISKRTRSQNAGFFSIKMTAGASVLLCVLLLSCGVANADEITGIIVRAPYWLRAGKTIKDMPAAFRVSRFCPPGADTISVGWDDYASIGRFADKDHPFDVLIYNSLPNPSQTKILLRQFPKGKAQPQRFFIGRKRLVAVVHKASRLDRLTSAQIQQLLREEDKDFKRPKLAGLASQARCYIEASNSWSRDYLKRTRMSFRKTYDWGWHDGYYSFRKDIVECHGGRDVIAKVRKDRNGIGFFLYDPHDAKLTAALKKVKVLAIGETDKGPFVKPKLAPVVQEDYPLSEPLILYLHPKAPPLARKFCEFAVSEEGAKIAAKHGLITPWHENQYLGELRLKEMKAGKGVRLSAVGVRGGKAIMPALAIEYVRAKEVVRLSYAPASSAVSAVGRFVAGGAGKREQLLLDDKPSERALERYGEKWNGLGADWAGVGTLGGGYPFKANLYFPKAYNPVAWAAPECTESGRQGQYNSTSPGTFMSHYLVKYDAKHYDPSYGLGGADGFANLAAYETVALAGGGFAGVDTGQVSQGTKWGARKNTGIQELRFIKP